MVVKPEAIGRLAFKYARLLELRKARAAGDPIPERAVFAELAREFPGALYELDTLPLDALEAKARATAEASERGESEAWMALMIGYHALFRAALFVKIRAKKGQFDDARLEALAGLASEHAGREVDVAFARAAASPPGGRLQTVVLERLANDAGSTAAEIKKAIFPQSRR